MTSPQPFCVDIPEKTIDEIKTRVASFPWHEMPDDGGWDYGANLEYMRSICTYWIDDFELLTENEINQLIELCEKKIK